MEQRTLKVTIKKQVTYKGKPIKITIDFLTNSNSGRHGMIHFKLCKTVVICSLDYYILYTVKLSFITREHISIININTRNS